MPDQAKEHPILFSAPMIGAILAGRKTVTRRVIKNINPTLLASNPKATQIANAIKCPYGEAGDHLWVRETWQQMEHRGGDVKESIVYRADGEHDYGWRPSIFMPRWASRITLEIVGVRVERLQEIGIDDVLAEGFEPVKEGDHANQYWQEETMDNFILLWEKLNGKKYPWSSNPWVWRVEFRRVV